MSPSISASCPLPHLNSTSPNISAAEAAQEVIMQAAEQASHLPPGPHPVSAMPGLSGLAASMAMARPPTMPFPFFSMAPRAPLSSSLPLFTGNRGMNVAWRSSVLQPTTPALMTMPGLGSRGDFPSYRFLSHQGAPDYQGQMGGGFPFTSSMAHNQQMQQLTMVGVATCTCSTEREREKE